MVPLKRSRLSMLENLKGRNFRPFFYGLLLLLPSITTGQDHQQLSFQFETLNYSESTSIRSISGEWDDGIDPGDMALSLSRWAVGYEFDALSLQVLQRYDTYYKYANDTASFIYQIENREPLTDGEQFDLLIKPKQLFSKGLRLGYRKQLSDQFNLQAFLSLLSAVDILQGSLEGSATAVGVNDYDFNFESDLVYKHDPLFGREAMNLSGDGYAVDLFLQYVIDEHWNVNLELLDLAGELSISDAPYTTATATSNVKNYDDEGYVVYDPVISGLESKKDFTARFEMQTHVSVSYQVSTQNKLVFQHHHFDNINFRELQFAHSLGTSRVTGHLIPQLNVIGVSYQSPVFMAGLLTDDFDSQKMKYLELFGRLQWSF